MKLQFGSRNTNESRHNEKTEIRRWNIGRRGVHTNNIESNSSLARLLREKLLCSRSYARGNRGESFNHFLSSGPLLTRSSPSKASGTTQREAIMHVEPKQYHQPSHSSLPTSFLTSNENASFCRAWLAPYNLTIHCTVKPPQIRIKLIALCDGTLPMITFWKYWQNRAGYNRCSPLKQKRWTPKTQQQTNASSFNLNGPHQNQPVALKSITRQCQTHRKRVD